MRRRIHVTEVAIYHLVYSGCWMRVVQIQFYITVIDILFAAKVPEVVVLLGADCVLHVMVFLKSASLGG
jgi:hypothetical protein